MDKHLCTVDYIIWLDFDWLATATVGSYNKNTNYYYW